MPEPKNSNQNSTLSFPASVMDAGNLPGFSTSTQGHCGALTMCGNPEYQSSVNLLDEIMSFTVRPEVRASNITLGTGSIMTTPLSNLALERINTFTLKNGVTICATRDGEQDLIYRHSGNEETVTSNELLELLLATTVTPENPLEDTAGTEILGDSSDNI